MDPPRNKLKKRYSQNSQRTSSPDLKHGSTPSNRFKATRANSFKDATITQFLYPEEEPTEETGKQHQKISRFKPSELQSRKRIMSNFIDNPFLRARNQCLEKDIVKQGLKHKVEHVFDNWQQEEVVFDKERVTFRSIREQFQKRRINRNKQL